jgi:serine/threonine protein kinase
MKRERIIWALIEHPNILPLLGYIEEFRGYGALVSPVSIQTTRVDVFKTFRQWCIYGDAETWLDREGHKVPLLERIRLVRLSRNPCAYLTIQQWTEVSSALEYLHAHKPVLIHGDLKPVSVSHIPSSGLFTDKQHITQSNVLIDDHLQAKLCDFGLMRVLQGEEPTELTTTTAHTGTDRYKAPEFVISDEDEDIVPTTASDVYGLGCIGVKVCPAICCSLSLVSYHLVSISDAAV